MTPVFPGQYSSPALFSNQADTQRSFKNANEAERLGQASESEMLTEMVLRAEDGLEVKESFGEGEVSLTAKRYRETASDMKVALSKLTNDAPDYADYGSSVAMQILGVESTGDEFADTILKGILYGDPTDDVALSAKFTMADVTGTAGDDKVEVTTEGDIYGAMTGDGADVVTLTGDRVFNVNTDANPSLTVSVVNADGEGGGHWQTGQAYANNDTLTINAGSARNISTGGGDDQLTINADNLTWVDAGQGNDRVNVSADYVNGVNAGAGDDIITLQATIANNISGGDGSDWINVAAVRGTIDGGAGADYITVSARESVNVRTGRGDDVVEINDGGGTVTLERRFGDGDDIVILGEGADVKIAGGTPTAIERQGDLLRLTFADGGSLMLSGIEAAGSITLAGSDTPLDIPPAGQTSGQAPVQTSIDRRI